MEKSSLDRNRSRVNYYTWVGIFFAALVIILGSIYYATIKIDYVWRWNTVPGYFLGAEETFKIEAKEAGTVESIGKEGDDTVARIKTEDGRIVPYRFPKGEAWVSEGDSVYPGDIVGSYKKWRTGILLQGMWLTLKVSLYSIIFGILLGLIGGVARISSNPALKWSAITYVELIRGSPLLVQIFIWYFVLATLINELLKKICTSKAARSRQSEASHWSRA